MLADIVVDLQYGDCGKGKVTHHLCKTEGYTHVIRYNGGCNAGHTIYHNERRFITHHVPAGVFFGVKSIIGPCCVLNIDQFFQEIKELEEGGIKTQGLLFIAENAHIITKNHLEEDGKDTKIGTTKRGNGPAYRDKYDRKGLRAKDVPALRPYLINLYQELHERYQNPKILEVGSGTGGNLKMLSSFGDLTSVEISELAINISKIKTGNIVDIKSGSLPDNLPNFTHNFDLICLFDVLEHI